VSNDFQELFDVWSVEGNRSDIESEIETEIETETETNQSITEKKVKPSSYLFIYVQKDKRTKGQN
jgi:hypothetical protein